MVGEKFVGTDQYEGATASAEPGFSYGENEPAYIGWEWDTHRVAAKPDASSARRERGRSAR